MKLPDPPEGFLDLAAAGLLEALLLRGYPLFRLEDPDELTGVVATDEAFAGFRKYPGRIFDAIRETALLDVNRIMVAEILRDDL